MTELQAPRSSYTAANAVHSGANGSFLYRWWVPKLSHTFPYEIGGCGCGGPHGPVARKMGLPVL